MVALPIGAFFLAMLADIGFLNDPRPFWAEMAAYGIGIGVVTALIAAALGLIDFFGLPEGSRVRATAIVHMVVNVSAVILYAASFYLRYNAATGVAYEPSTAALGASFLALATLLVGGWLGGKMVYELRAGVVEPGDLAPRTRY
jgi:uncharacterized membrane protein